jgi:hypothetical protein
MSNSAPIKPGRSPVRRFGGTLVCLGLLGYLLLPLLLNAHRAVAHGSHDAPAGSLEPACDFCALAATLQTGCRPPAPEALAVDRPLAGALPVPPPEPFRGCPIPVAALPRGPPAA